MPKKIIDNEVKKKIFKIIDAWQGKLTWENLCEQVSRELELDEVISRHTLQGYDDIKLAFQNRKLDLKTRFDSPVATGDMALDKAYQRIKILEVKNQRLEKELSATREQFVRWQSNLYRMGVNMNEIQKKLDRPLVDMNRSGQK